MIVKIDMIDKIRGNFYFVILYFMRILNVLSFLYYKNVKNLIIIMWVFL